MHAYSILRRLKIYWALRAPHILFRLLSSISLHTKIERKTHTHTHTFRKTKKKQALLLLLPSITHTYSLLTIVIRMKSEPFFSYSPPTILKWTNKSSNQHTYILLVIQQHFSPISFMLYIFCSQRGASFFFPFSSFGKSIATEWNKK